LAILLAPNQWLHKSFGKYLFSGCDILAGVLIHKLLVSAILPRAHPRTDSPSSRFTSKEHVHHHHHHGRPGPDDKSKNATRTPILDEDKEEDARRARATLLVALHLLNPIVIGISTRGSSESVLTLLVLLTLFCALRGWWDCTAVFLGICTHWKIYPVIYGVSCVGVIGMERLERLERQHGGGEKKPRAPDVFSRMVRWIDVLVNAKTARFALISGGTFFILGALIYSV
jgi:phosphatidylinositol glycan class M